LNQSLDENDYILANLEFSGYYRVNYEVNNWKNIIKILQTNKSELTAGTRAQLINDIFSLSQTAIISPDLPLELIGYLKNEFEFLPVAAFLTRIKYFLDMLSSNQLNLDLKTYLASLINPVYEQIGWYENTTNVDHWLLK
jgi:hypothetical protein